MLRILALLSCALLWTACDTETDQPAPADTSADTIASEDAPGADDTGTDAETPGLPEHFPARERAADEAMLIPGLGAGVRVLYDGFGIPHIYGADRRDVTRAQGFVMARHRLFHMHSLRTAASGRLATLQGPTALSGDVYLRTLGLRRVAERVAEAMETEFPEEYALLVAFAEGINAYIDALERGDIPASQIPQVLQALQLDLEPWTPVDTLAIVRLLTWQLGFGGQVEPDTILSITRELQEAWDGTLLEGIEADVFDLTPPATVSTVDGTAGSKPGPSPSFDLRAALRQPRFQKLPTDYLRQVREAREALDRAPHHAFRGLDYGSNNWVVSGALTASGKAIVANDPHLSLSNPSVFSQYHLTDTLAGGDFDLAGVNFSGAPGIVLGTNGVIAWGATVFFSDVTDVYVEELTADRTAVMFEGAEVALDIRQEVFDFPRTGETCDESVTGWLQNLEPVVEAVAEYGCRLTVTIREVPHHGPLIPWTIGTDAEGDPIAMSWRWTGFDVTHDLVAFMKASVARDWESFKAAIDNFGVGAQNFVYGDVEGNIGWYPSHRLPIREHIAAGDYSNPPLLPMPGDGSAEWDGFVPRDELPQAYNPEQGYLVTANSDPTGTSFDGDVFDDGHYLGYLWAAGFRTARITERLTAAESPAFTMADMSDIQADHYSNLGARLRGPLVDALDAAESGADPAAAAVWTHEMAPIRDLLADWNLQAANGVGAEPGSEEAKAAAAAAVFNVWVTFFVRSALDEAGLADIGDRLRASLLLAMVEDPASMVTYDPDTGDSRLWDVVATGGEVETRAEIMVLAFAQALDFLANPEKVGPSESGGFGSANPADWRWGALHTLTLRHPVLPTYNIPAPSEHPNGQPRHGDNFSVDASHPGMVGQNFTYNHGPAVRHVMEMSTPVERTAVLPGGQNEDPRRPHYSDQFALWAENQTIDVPYGVDEVVERTESVLDLLPAE